jgi:hypothetical protein
MLDRVLKSLDKIRAQRLFSKLPSPWLLGVFAGLFQLGVAQADFGSIVDIGLGGDFYFTDESANNGQGFVNLLIQNTWSESQLWVDVGAGGLVGDTASSYVKAPQLYYRQGAIDSPYHVTVGRALFDWSHGDEFWNMGITQPIFKWNEARPETQGLTGLFLGGPIIKDALELNIFWSPLFIPTQGPSFEVSNGNLTSSNPWFNDPVEVLVLAGNERADLNYEIQYPNAIDVIDQTSYGARLSTPQNKKGFLFNAFYLNKPRNDLILPFEGALNLSTFTGDISVIPRVARHQVTGADLGWNFARMKSVVSWVNEADIDYDIPDGTTFPILPDQNIFSFVNLFRLTKTQRLWLAYINVDREPTQIGGLFSGSQISTFANRNRFEEAARVKWEGLMFKKKGIYKVKASMAYNQSLANDNIWISTDIKWALYKGVEVFSQCDFFGGSEETIIGNDFMSTYQNNDRCFLGGHYAF